MIDGANNPLNPMKKATPKGGPKFVTLYEDHAVARSAIEAAKRSNR